MNKIAPAAVDPGTMPSVFANNTVVTTNIKTQTIRITFVEEILGGQVAVTCVTIPFAVAGMMTKQIATGMLMATKQQPESEKEFDS